MNIKEFIKYLQGLDIVIDIEDGQLDINAPKGVARK